jgi:hypothetical protein
MNVTGKDLERILKSTPVVQQGISHYDVPGAPIVLHMLLADGARVTFVAHEVQHQPAATQQATQPAAAPTLAPKTPPGTTQSLGFGGHGINNFRALGDR